MLGMMVPESSWPSTTRCKPSAATENLAVVQEANMEGKEVRSGRDFRVRPGPQ